MDSAPQHPPLALIVNDQEWSLRSLESLLAPRGYAVLKAYTAQQALQLMRETSPDLVIIDFALPDQSGIDLCAQLRQDREIGPSVPIIITTAGRLSREDRIAALSAGAWDLLGMPLDAETFLLRIEAYLRSKFDADRAREESLIDELTGLYNLRGLMRRARELGADAYRNERALACVAFAPRLGTAGQPAEGGETEVRNALDAMARVFRLSGRVSDAIGRIRLSEFVVVAPGTGDAGALLLARRISNAVLSAQNGEESEVRVLAGYHAVPNVRESAIRPAALLAGATTTLRQIQMSPDGPTIRGYEGNGNGPSPDSD